MTQHDPTDSLNHAIFLTDPTRLDPWIDPTRSDPCVDLTQPDQTRGSTPPMASFAGAFSDACVKHPSSGVRGRTPKGNFRISGDIRTTDWQTQPVGILI